MSAPHDWLTPWPEAAEKVGGPQTLQLLGATGHVAIWRDADGLMWLFADTLRRHLRQPIMKDALRNQAQQSAAQREHNVVQLSERTWRTLS